jgi:hypothetical protein
MRKLLLAALVLFPLSAFTQVLNIEQERIKTDTTGWSGTAGLSFQYIKNQKEMLNAGLKVHVQFKTEHSLWLMLTDYSLVTSGKDNYSNAGIEHLRYNYKFNNWFTAECFTQAQFNKVMSVKFRWLTGAGPRFKIVKTKKFRLYGAALYMYEYEELENPSVFHRDQRMSSYLSFTWSPLENLRLINTTYFQPKLNYLADHRISSQTDVIVKIAGHFGFGAGYLYYYDSFPPEGIVKETHYLTNKITYEF